MLISSILGIDSRSTMDMDTTIKGFYLDIETLSNILEDIITIPIDDGVLFNIINIQNIRDDDYYGGLRVHIQAVFDNMPIDLKIDVTTGDRITYKEISYTYNLMLENREIHIWSYNIETIIAEKYESIIKRSILNTRMRDYYDIYMLTHMKKDNIMEKMLHDAIVETSKHRKTFEIIKDKETVDEVIASIEDNKLMQKQWTNYQNTYEYSTEILYNELIESIKIIRDIYFKEEQYIQKE